MSTASERLELERLRDAVGELIGFGFEEDRLEQLGVAVRNRVTELRLPGLDAYIARLRAPEHRAEEVPALASLVTVTETYFHRSYDQIAAFTEEVVPKRLISGGRRLRVLSAGCASGEEPYSLAIALRESFPDIEAWDVQIVALDVNRAMLIKAKQGRYSAWSLRATPEPVRARYFERHGNEYQLSDGVMKMVEFRELNLAEKNRWPLEGYGADAIFCRNVIMYFSPEVMAQVIGKLTRSLGAGGYLFLGHAETLRGLSHDYHLCHTHGTFYYQKRGDAEAARADEPRSPWRERERDPLLDIVGETSWFDAIQNASLRVAEMADAHALAPRRASPLPGELLPFNAEGSRSKLAPDPELLTDVLELMRRERFSEALSRIEAMPPEASAHPDALLLSAILLTNHGKVELAERTCERLLEVDDLNAGAHYLKALCREHASDNAQALEHDRIATHLDPTFAMPRLHAGLLSKRSGDRASARRELAQALVLLDQEETSRLLLFGGGFSRAALVALCQGELSRLGEGAR